MSEYDWPLDHDTYANQIRRRMGLPANALKSLERMNLYDLRKINQFLKEKNQK